MPPPAAQVELTEPELRAVVGFAAGEAARVLPLFEDANPADPRPRAAVDAARTYAAGAPRTRLQRTTAADAHRAAREAADGAAGHAARAAGDAAAAAYLHPLAQPTQVGHILRAASNAARAAELAAGDEAEGHRWVRQAAQRAPSVIVDVLRRYPPAPTGASGVARLMAELDATLRG